MLLFLLLESESRRPTSSFATSGQTRYPQVMISRGRTSVLMDVTPLAAERTFTESLDLVLVLDREVF
jgi:hypothetical protein